MGDHRALWVLGDGAVAGVGRHAMDIARAGIPGWEVAMLVPPGQLAGELRDLGATLIPNFDAAFDKAAGPTSGIRALHRAIRAYRPSIVHSHLSWADVVTVAAVQGTGARAVSTEHGISDVPGLYNSSPWIAAAKRTLHRGRLRATSGLLCVSRATARSADVQWGPLRVPHRSVVHNGIDPPEEIPVRIGARIGILSRLSQEKRVDLAIRAFALVRQVWPAATLTIAGIGDEEGALRDLVTKMDLDGTVTFAGYVPSAEFWERVDILVQLSWWENCSYALLDAVVFGRGIVATDVGGNSEFLSSDCIIQPDPSADTVARAVLAERQRTHTLPIGWPDVATMASAVSQLYEQVIGGDPPR